ncbi:hypothetical protein J3R83DRAFT_2221 [Lanmaoa asiatica]|nr:hypothetical protein J3R83DRAFT_2221 [Lanmaoa asiatica]
MHAGVRRVPAERVRHAKRLGHVQVGSGPTFPVLAVTGNGAATTAPIQPSAIPTTTALSQTAPTTTSAKQSSSNVLSSSSPTQTPSSALSSTTTSSTSTAASFTSTQSFAATASSSFPITQPTTSASTSPTSSSPSTSQTEAAAVTNNGLSGGAIAGIIAGAIIVGVAIIVFFVRKTYLRRRERKHISWNRPSGLDEPNLFPEISERPASFTSVANTPQRSVPLSPFEAYGQPMYSAPVPPVVHMQPTIPTYAVPMPPPATYNNPTPVATYPTQHVPSTYGGAGISSTLPSVRAQHTLVEATVKCTFVPTLPDELSITTGERIFIVEQYDDGWDLCTNGRDERGMVPRECLERAISDQPGIGWKNAQRISSLNPDGIRF